MPSSRCTSPTDRSRPAGLRNQTVLAPTLQAVRALLQEWLELCELAHSALRDEDEAGLLRALAGRDALIPRIETAVRAAQAAGARGEAVQKLGYAVAAADARLLERMQRTRDAIAEELHEVEHAEVVAYVYEGGGRPGASAIDLRR